SAQLRVGHDLGRVLERVAERAIPAVRETPPPAVPARAVIAPGDAAAGQEQPEIGLPARRNGELAGTERRRGSVAAVPGVVVVDEVVGTLAAIAAAERRVGHGAQILA